MPLLTPVKSRSSSRISNRCSCHLNRRQRRSHRRSPIHIHLRPDLIDSHPPPSRSDRDYGGRVGGYDRQAGEAVSTRIVFGRPRTPPNAAANAPTIKTAKVQSAADEIPLAAVFAAA